MNVRNVAAITGILLNVAAAPSQAKSPIGDQNGGTATIDVAGHAVPVVKGGLYDRYRIVDPEFETLV